MHFKNLICVAAGGLLLLAAGTVRAQKVYSLDSCVAMALRANSGIESATHRTAKQTYEARALYANYFPKVSLQAFDLYSTLDGSRTLDLAQPIAQYTADQLHAMMPFLIRNELQERIAQSLGQRLDKLNPDIDMDVNNLLNINLTLEQPIWMGPYGANWTTDGGGWRNA